MTTNRLAAAMAAVMMGAVLASANTHAQNKPVQAWAPPQGQEPDPAKRLPAATQSHDAGHATQQPVPRQVGEYPQAQPYPAGQQVRSHYEEGRGGFFVGVQGGSGWVYENVDQSARAISAGYRWQAGPVALVGVEVARGQLGDTTDDGWYFGEVDYASIGVNARFNFGSTNPVYGLVRAGYMAAEDEFDDSVDGGYLGVGLGVDFNRHLNMSLVYTNYVYFNDYYWEDGDFYYDASRADMLMLGVEARF